MPFSTDNDLVLQNVIKIQSKILIFLSDHYRAREKMHGPPLLWVKVNCLIYIRALHQSLCHQNRVQDASPV